MPDGERPSLQPPEAPEALLVCPICRESLAGSNYETHLRRLHHLYGYRGVRRSFDDTIEAMFDDLLRVPPFAVAWPALVRLTREEHGARAETFLAQSLGAALARLPQARLARILPDLAGLVAPGNAPILAALANDTDTPGRLLALTALGLLPPPLDPLLVQPLRLLLVDRSLPEEAQAQAMAAILPHLRDPLQARSLLEKLIAGLSTTKSVNRLCLVEKQTGALPALTAFYEGLQDEVRMSCPRCEVRMRRPAMMQHLWDEHRLVLDGLRVREPWGIIEEWLAACKVRHDPVLLERCRVAAVKIDGDVGLIRLSRLALSQGVADLDGRRALLAVAREQHSACCPWCYALVPMPQEGLVLHVNHRPGRLSARGYSVEIDERGLRPLLEVRTPNEIIYKGIEPNQPLSPRGKGLLVAGPLVLTAFLFALVWSLAPVMVLLVLAWLGQWVVRLVWRSDAPPARRVLDHAWSLLVPRFHAREFSVEDSAFAAGLARLYGRLLKDGVPPEELARLLRITEPAVKRGEAPPGHLAALCRLEIERIASLGKDPIPVVVRWMARCFEGRLPLAFAQQVLENWTTPWWSAGNLARLRILLCDRAFEAGFEVGSLMDAGQNAPALGTVLRTDVPLALAGLRLLWSLRPTRPWDRLGEVLTAFELAGDSSATNDLAEQPDVLLWQNDLRWTVVADNGLGKKTTAVLQLTPKGVWLQDVVFTQPPRMFEVRLRSTGSEMTTGPHTFRSPMDLDPLSRQLEKWFRYGFHEFLPQLDRVLSWQSPDRAAILRAWGAVPCPECKKFLLPRVGETGVALDEMA